MILLGLFKTLLIALIRLILWIYMIKLMKQERIKQPLTFLRGRNSRWWIEFLQITVLKTRGANLEASKISHLEEFQQQKKNNNNRNIAKKILQCQHLLIIVYHLKFRRFFSTGNRVEVLTKTKEKNQSFNNFINQSTIKELMQICRGSLNLWS